jgi:type IV pilus assembly protein PilQ
MGMKSEKSVKRYSRLRALVGIGCFLGSTSFTHGIEAKQTNAGRDPFSVGGLAIDTLHEADSQAGVLGRASSSLDTQLENRKLANTKLNKKLNLDMAILPLIHARSEDLAKVCHPEQGGGLLSQDGTLSIDERTNSLIVIDHPEVIKSIKRVVSKLDVPVKQVKIEARIVMMNEGELDEFGIRWGIVNDTSTLPVGGSIEGSVKGEEGNDKINEQLSVNLPVTSSGGASLAFQLAKLGSGTLLDLELSALQSESKANIISSPRLLTTNRKAAYIEQGTEIPYLESNDDGKSTIAFKKAVLSLKVTPYLSDNDQLILDLNVTQDRPGEVVKTGTGEAVAIVTQRMGTQVKIHDGETIVLGGIYQQSIINRHDKVPLLGDLPLVGRLFRRDYQHSTKSELLIFVTPTVLIQ